MEPLIAGLLCIVSQMSVGLLKWSPTYQSGKWKTVKICESWERSFWSMFAIHSWPQFSTDKFLPFTTGYFLGELKRLLMCQKSLCESTLQNQAKMKVNRSFSSLLLQIIVISVAGTNDSHLYLSHCQLLIRIISSYIKWSSWKSEVEKDISAWQLEFLFESTKKLCTDTCIDFSLVPR